MIQEDKILLIKDLSARLPYGVIIEVPDIFKYYKRTEVLTSIIEGQYVNNVDIDLVKPYLFPLSSMTEKQRTELSEVSKAILIYSTDAEIVVNRAKENLLQFYPVFDWFNKNHFDYRGLIEKGLAINATDLNIYHF